MEIENIEQWKGQEVVDPDGEKVGKLEELYTLLGADEPAIGAVKTGLVGKTLHLIPLFDATLGRDHIRIGATKDHVKSAPTLQTPGRLTRAEEVAFAQHYGLQAPPADEDDAGAVRYESSGIRGERETARADAMRRADELEAEAERHRHQSETHTQNATQASSAADQSRQESDRLLDEARQLRKSMGDG